MPTPTDSTTNNNNNSASQSTIIHHRERYHPHQTAASTTNRTTVPLSRNGPSNGLGGPGGGSANVISNGSASTIGGSNAKHNGGIGRCRQNTSTTTTTTSSDTVVTTENSENRLYDNFYSLKEEDFEKHTTYIVPDLAVDDGVPNRAEASLPRNLVLKASQALSDVSFFIFLINFIFFKYLNQ